MIGGTRAKRRAAWAQVARDLRSNKPLEDCCRDARDLVAEFSAADAAGSWPLDLSSGDVRASMAVYADLQARWLDVPLYLRRKMAE